MQKIQFKKDYTHGNGHVEKKGKVSLVTSRHAQFLEANGFAAPVLSKEEKEAAKRNTK